MYPQDRFVIVDKIQTRYWDEGTGDTLLVCVHGLGGYVESWWPSIWDLAKCCHVIALDLPGFGKSDKPAQFPYGVRGFCEFLWKFLTQLGHTRCVLIGHSMGGAICLHFAMEYPDFVQQIVLIGSGGLGPEVLWGLRLTSLPVLGELMVRPSLKRSQGYMSAMMYKQGIVSQQMAQEDFEMFSRPGSQRAFLKCLRAFGHWGGQGKWLYDPVLKNLSAYPMPVLCIWGREDPVVPVKHAEVIRRMPLGQVMIFDQCGHVPQFEHATEFVDSVLGFLK